MWSHGRFEDMNIGVDLITLISSIMIWHISTQTKVGTIDTVQILHPQFKQYKLWNDDKDGAPISINESSAHMSEIAFCLEVGTVRFDSKLSRIDLNRLFYKKNRIRTEFKRFFLYRFGSVRFFRFWAYWAYFEFLNF